MIIYFNIFLGVLWAAGLFLIPVWCKRQPEIISWKLCDFLWTISCFIVYLFSLEVISQTFYFLIPAAFLGLFFFFYLREKRRLVNGLLFNLFLLSFGLYLALLVFSTQSPLLILLLGGAFVALLIFAIFGLYTLIIFLYWNALVVWKKEGHSLANLLTLLLAIGLTLLLILNYVSGHFLPAWAAALFSLLPMLLVYFAFVFYNFLTVSILYQFNRPKYTQDYIIVLGAGLIDGEKVPPLLGSRIDKAISFYEKQQRKTGKIPKILMSGGKGDDEHLSEGLAMKKYALAKGIPEKDLLVEGNSVNTLENMRFSKEVMEDDSGSKKYTAIFTTNNFHLFRAGLFARQAALKADGIGAKTAFYFLPNAFLREFIAIVMMNKRRHVIYCSLIAALSILSAALQFFFG